MFIENVLDIMDRGYQLFLTVFILLLGASYIVRLISSRNSRRSV